MGISKFSGTQGCGQASVTLCIRSDFTKTGKKPDLCVFGGKGTWWETEGSHLFVAGLSTRSRGLETHLQKFSAPCVPPASPQA